MSDEEKPDGAGKAEEPMPGFVFVKGGTSTSTYDNEIARRTADAEKRRGEQDAMGEIAKRGVRPGEAARLGSLRFVNQATPMAVLFYMNRDGTVRRECVSEVTTIEGEKQGEVDVMFTMVCEKCMERGVPQGEAQCMVRSSHRKFWIDEKKRGQVVKLRHPQTGAPWPVIICGTLWCKDRIKCDNYNCDWSVVIEDSCVKDW